MIYIMSCVWLDYMVKYFQTKNCEGSSPTDKKCTTSFLVPGDSPSVHMDTRTFYLAKCRYEHPHQSRASTRKSRSGFLLYYGFALAFMAGIFFVNASHVAASCISLAAAFLLQFLLIKFH